MPPWRAPTEGRREATPMKMTITVEVEPNETPAAVAGFLREAAERLEHQAGEAVGTAGKGNGNGNAADTPKPEGRMGFRHGPALAVPTENAVG